MSGERQHDVYARRGARNLAVAGILGALALLLFAVTIVKLGENATSPFTEQFEPALRYRDETPRDARDAAAEAPAGADQTGGQETQ